VVFRVLLHIRHAVRPISDHTAVRYRFVSSHINPSSRTQGTCRHGEKSMDHLRPFFHDFGAVRLWDVPSSLCCTATSYVPSRRLLNELSKVSPVLKATVIPDIPLEEYQFCLFQRWRVGEITNTAFSLVYGAFYHPLMSRQQSTHLHPRYLGFPRYNLFSKEPTSCTFSWRNKPSRQHCPGCLHVFLGNFFWPHSFDSL
jgi:hypothetical protein